MADKGNERSLLLPLLGVAGTLLVACAVVWFFFLRSSGADVRGEVTLDGEAVAGAVITFVAEDANKQAPIIGLSNEAGKYQLIGNAGALIPVGNYKVAVIKEALEGGKVPEGEKLEKARADGSLANRLPKAYEDYKTTPLKVNVRAGRNAINLELKKQ